MLHEYKNAYSKYATTIICKYYSPCIINVKDIFRKFKM